MSNEKIGKKSKEQKSFERKVVTVGCIVIFIIVMVSLYALYNYLKYNEVELTFKEHYDNTVNELNEEINELTYEKDTLLREINDLTYEKNELEKYYYELAQNRIIDKWVPANSGSIHSYMPYEQNWLTYSEQYKLNNAVSSEVWYDDYGYARLEDRYFVAVKPYYGDIGDYIDVYQEDGSIIPCIIGDNKGFENKDIYIHHDGSIVEFMVGSGFNGVKNTHPDFCQNITLIRNISNYFDE